MTSPHGFKRDYSRRLLSTFVTLGLLAACSDDDSFPVIPEFDAGPDAGGLSTDPTYTEPDLTTGIDTAVSDFTSTDTSDVSSTDGASTDYTATDASTSNDTATDDTATDDTATDSTSGPDAATSDETSTSDSTLTTDDSLTSDETYTSAPTGDTTWDAGSSDTTTDLTIIDVTFTFGDAGADAATSTDETEATDDTSSGNPDETSDASAGESSDAGADGATTEMPEGDAGATISLTTQDYAGSTESLMPDELEDAYLHATLEGEIDALLLAQTDAGGQVIGEQFWWSKPGEPIPASVDVLAGQTTYWNVYVIEEETPVMSNGAMTALAAGTHHLDIYASWVPFTETAYFRLFAFDALGSVIDTQDFVY